MVSIEAMNRLREAFNKVQFSAVQFDEHSQSLYDVVFDLNTAESALIGIADQLLSNMMPSTDQLAVLDKTLIHGTEWMLFDGGKRDLTLDAGLLQHAHNLLSLQQECRAYLKNHRGMK